MNIPIFGSNGKSKQNLNLSACDFKHEEYMHIKFWYMFVVFILFSCFKANRFADTKQKKNHGMALVLDSYTCKQFVTHSIFVYRHK